MLHRGGQLSKWIVKPEKDGLWSEVDNARAALLEARWKARGVREDERKTLIPCAIMKARWPDTRFSAAIETRLIELACVA
jgi:hypothetical protein